MTVSIPSSDRIENLIREVAATEIMPRWRSLSASEKWEKRPGSVVTAADVASEEFLERELPPLLPGSVVVGEEMIENNPAALELLDGDAPVWVLDAVDGVEFCQRQPRFRGHGSACPPEADNCRLDIPACRRRHVYLRTRRRGVSQW